MKRSKDFKTVLAMIIIVLSVVVLYIVKDMYFSKSSLSSEYIFKTTDKQVVSVNSFVVRDENRVSGGKNLSILKRSDNRTYVPVVSDSASVAKNQTIAVSFKSKQDAKAYNEMKLLDEKIQHLDELQDQDNLSHLNVITLNSEIASTVNDYLSVIESGNYANLSESIRKISYKMTTREIAVGKKLNFKPLIKSYKAEKRQLSSSISSKYSVLTPYAGYFVSTVDGYESSFNYNKVADGKVDSAQAAKLLDVKPKSTDNAFGKIIGQHTWYLVCNMALVDASNIKKGYYVNVSFPEKGIYDVAMSVDNISSRAGDTVCVILKCTSMNRDLSSLRKERAEITITSYDGLRISNDALTSDETGQQGVYVLGGKRVVFKPINIIHYSSNYVIAVPYIYYKESDNPKKKEKVIDYEKTDKVEIKAFDKVVWGRNLYDGKIVD